MLERRQVQRWFPDDELLLVPADVLMDRVSDPVARDVLTRVGLPESYLEVMDIDPGAFRVPRTVAQAYADEDAEPPTGSGSMWVLGHLGQFLLALDPETGGVYQVGDDSGMRILASNLASFVRTLGAVALAGPGVAAQGDVEVAEQRLLAHVVDSLRKEDAAVLPEAELAWSDVVPDVVKGLA